MEERDDRLEQLQPPLRPASDADAVGLGRCCICGRSSSPPTAGSDPSEQLQQLLLLDCFHGVCSECATSAGETAAIACPECGGKTVRADLGEPLTSASAASLACSSLAPPVRPRLCDNCSQDAGDDKRREAGHRCADCNQLFCRPCLRVHDKFAPGHATELLNAVTAAAQRLPLCAEHTSASRSLYCADCSRLRCETCSLACAGRGHVLTSAADAVAAASEGSAVGGLVALARDDIRDALGELSSQRRQASEATAIARDGDRTPPSLVPEPRGIATEPALRLLQRNERRAAAALRHVRANAERRLVEERDRRAAQAARVDAQLDRLASYAERLLLRPPPEQHAAATAAAAAALDQRRQLVGRMRTLLAERKALSSLTEAASVENDAGLRPQQIVRETTAEEAETAAAALLGLASVPRGSASSQKRDVEGSEDWLTEAEEEDDDELEEDEEEHGEDYDSNSCNGDPGDDSSRVSPTATPSSDRLEALSSDASRTPPADGSCRGGDVDERTLLSCCACGQDPVNPVILSCLHCCCTGCVNGLASTPDLVRGASSPPLSAGEASTSWADGECVEQQQQQQQRQIKCSLCDSITPAASVRLSTFVAKRLRQLAGASAAAATTAAAAPAAAYCDMCARNGQENVAASHICPDCNDTPLCAACLHWHNKFSRTHAPRSIGGSSSASSGAAQQSQRSCERHGIGCGYDTYCFECATLLCTNGARACASAGHDAVAIGSPRAVEQARGSAASLCAELASATARVDAAAASAAGLVGALSCALDFELKLLDGAADDVYRAVEEARANAREALRTIYGSLRTRALKKRAEQGSASRRIGQAAAFCRLLLSSDGEADILDHHREVTACLRALGTEADGLASACSRFESSPPKPAVVERCEVDRELVAQWIGLPHGDAAKLLDWKDFAPEQQRQPHLQQQQEQRQQRQQNQLLQPSGVAPLRQQTLLIPTATDYRAPVRAAELVHSADERGTRTVHNSIRGPAANVIQTPRSVSGGYVDEARRSVGLTSSAVLLGGLQFEAVPTCVVEVTDDVRSLLLLCRSECKGGRRSVRSIVVAGPRRGVEEYAMDSGAMLSSWLPMPEAGPERDERPIVMAVAVASIAAGATVDAESVGGGGAIGDLLYVGLADFIPTVVVLRRLEMDDGVVWMDEQRIVLRAVPWQLAADGEFLVVAGAQQGDEEQPLPYAPGPYLDLYRRSGPDATEELFSHETAYDIRCVALIGKVVVTLSNNRMPSASVRDEQAYVLEAFSSRGDMLWRTNGFDATDMCGLPVAGLLCVVHRNDQRLIALSADDGRYVADVLGGNDGAIRGTSRVCFSSRANPFAMAALSTENWVSVYLATVEKRVGAADRANRRSDEAGVTYE